MGALEISRPTSNSTAMQVYKPPGSSTRARQVYKNTTLAIAIFSANSHNMSLSHFFYEPFYTLSDFDRLFDEAFNARTDGANQNNQVQRRDGSGNRSLRPR